MLFKMATKTEVENEVVEKSLENKNFSTVCKNLQFSDNNLKHPTRKRCMSTSILISSSPKKKKKEGQSMIPPKKFLLGGTISDPLNLNSLQNEDINKAMNKTPKSSPLHSNSFNIKKDQVNVIIPRNLSDPLELSMCDEDKTVESSVSDSLQQNTPQKCKAKKLFTKSLSDSGIVNEDDIATNNHMPECINEKKNVSSSPNKKFKTGPYENRICQPENNDIHCTVLEVLEEIINVVKSEIPVHPIDECSIPVKTAEVVVEKNIGPSKTSPSSEKKVEVGKKTHGQRENIKSKRFVSPVVSQPSLSEKNCKPQQVVVKMSDKPKQKVNKNEPKFKQKNSLFKYGNYNRYYGYRNPDDEDNRLKVLSECMDLFYGKDVLDIGCNIGHVTFSVARDFGAKSVIGMDIDRKLINIARKNVQYYINDTTHSSSHMPTNYQFNDYSSNSHDKLNCDKTKSFPISLPMMYGPINLPGMTVSGRFPYNVSFVQGNYVLESDALVSLETCKFDVILCLSITKWIHLNWGDDGLKRAFKRMYAQLRPGGMLVMEPQQWKSYGRRKTLTETIWQNYKNIQLKPPMFTEYLINEVGFANCETLAMPYNPSKGFQRPLKLYRKPNTVTKNEPNCTNVQPSETQTS